MTPAAEPGGRWRFPTFVTGANLPWLSYGGDFGASAWQPEGGCARPEACAALRGHLTALAAGGASLVRWFLFCDGRSGLLCDPGDGPAGLDAHVLRDMDAAIDEVDRAGLCAVFVLFDFHWFHRARIVNGVQLGGRGAWLIEPALRARTFERVLAPLCDRYGRTQAIAAWEIVNEPEWVLQGGFMTCVSELTRAMSTGHEPGPRHGRAGSWARPFVSRAVARAGVSRRTMRAIIAETGQLIHDRTTQAVTVGSASAGSLDLVRGLGLDLYQIHWYDRHELRSPLERPVADLALDRPVLLGEFPTRGSRLTPADIVTTARRAGYAGALAWSAVADDKASDGAAIRQALATPVSDGR